jgi:hypothetical protein
MNNELISLHFLLKNIRNLVKDSYPLKINYKTNIPKLSHFHLIPIDSKYIINENISINGYINNNKIKSIKTRTLKLSWKKYLKLLVSIININPCFENKLLYYVHRYNLIKDLHIDSIELNNDKVIEIQYLKNKMTLPKTSLFNNRKKNHFIFSSFLIDDNKKILKKELDRLIKYRDNYKEIHIHLEDNCGGDLVPVHLLVRCLIGKRDKWMKNIKKITHEKKIEEWDCWNEENEYHQETVKKLNLKEIPNFSTKYSGKIYLYISEKNGSAAWFLITYLIYGFSKKINRFSKICLGKNIKYGSIDNKSQIKLIGNSNTTTGDGNSINFNLKNVTIYIPTEQFISSSIKKIDFNRYWIQ